MMMHTKIVLSSGGRVKIREVSSRNERKQEGQSMQGNVTAIVRKEQNICKDMTGVVIPKNRNKMDHETENAQ